MTASDQKVLTKDLTWIGKGGAGYYVLYGEPDVDEVVQGAAALLDDEPHLFVLTSDRLGYRDRVALTEAFETGRPLMSASLVRPR